MKKQEKIQQIIDYVNAGGGAVQFHFLNELCLSVDNNKLMEVVLCKKTKENPFGIAHVPFKPDTLFLNRIISEISTIKKSK